MKINLKLKLLPYQLSIMKDADSLVEGIIGGTGTGKTWLIPRWLLLRMAARPGGIWIVSSPTGLMLKKNPIRYIRTFFDSINFKYKYNKMDGVISTILGEIHFISATKPDRMQGIHSYGIVADEAGQYPKEWWTTAIQRARYNGGQILLVTTPYSRNWLYQEVVQVNDKQYHIERPASSDNPFYDKAEIETAKERLPQWRFEMMYDGLFSRPSGMVYNNIQYVEPFDIPDTWQKIAGLDYGYNNPTAMIWLASPDGEAWYAYREIKQSKLTNTAIVELFQDRTDTKELYVDPSAAGLIAEFEQHNFRVNKANNDVLAGITAVQEGFNSNKLYIFNTLTNTRDEFEAYVWDRKNDSATDKVVKENDHLMDALRYGYYTRLANYAGEVRVAPWSIAR